VGVSPLRFTIGESDHASLLLASASLLIPSAAGRKQEKQSIGPLAPLLDRVPITFRPVIPAGRVALGDLSALESGALLKFDVRADATIELRVGETGVARGRIHQETETTVFKVQTRVGSDPAEESHG